MRCCVAARRACTLLLIGCAACGPRATPEAPAASPASAHGLGAADAAAMGRPLAVGGAAMGPAAAATGRPPTVGAPMAPAGAAGAQPAPTAAHAAARGTAPDGAGSCPAMVGRAPPEAGSGDPHAAHAVGGGPIAWVGRLTPGPGTTQRFAWPGTTFIGRFSGTGAAIILDEHGTPARPGDAVHAYAVHVDGSPAATLRTTAGRHRYVIAAALPPGPHTVAVRRRSAARRGVTDFGGLTVADGEMLPPPPRPDRRLLFVGDGPMAGEGPEQAAPPDEDAEAGYALRAAAALGADAQLVAAAGRGILRNAELAQVETMPLIAWRVLPQQPSPQIAPGDFSPQAVVVDLGRADFAVVPPAHATFARAYTHFLRALRHAYPRARLICVALADQGPHAAPLAVAVREAVAALHDNRAELLSLRGTDPSALARQLTVAIRRAAGW